jgi:hypothetical protein
LLSEQQPRERVSRRAAEYTEKRKTERSLPLSALSAALREIKSLSAPLPHDVAGYLTILSTFAALEH